MNDTTTTTDGDGDTPADVLRGLFPDDQPTRSAPLRGILLTLLERVERLEAQVSALAARGE